MDVARRQTLFTRVERATELPLLVLSFAFLALIALPDLVDVSEAAQTTIDGVFWLIWAVFACELGVKTYLAPNRRRYLISHWPDVIVVVVPVLRPLRLLRLVVVGARFWRSARTTLRQRTFSLAAIISLVAVGVAAVLMYAAERAGGGPIRTFADALWWASTTITTVGYGDVYPKTAAGRAIALVLMLLGISMFGVLTARVAAFFVISEEQESEPQKLDEILDRLDRIERKLSDETRLAA